MAYLQALSFVQGDERIRTAVKRHRSDSPGSIRAAITGVRVRRESSAGLMAGRTLTATGLTERGKPSLEVGERRSGERRGVRLDPRRMNQRNQPTRPRSVSPARFPSHGSEAA